MKNINESELRNYIFKKLQESYFDDLEFDDEAMKAAMSDINASGEEFEELGASKFEKDPKFKEKFTAALNRANLELPSDEAEVEHYAKLLKKRKAQEDSFGVGSLNEIEVEHIKDAKGKAIKLKSQVQHENGATGYVERFMVGDDKNMLVKVNWVGSKKAEPIVSPEEIKIIVKQKEKSLDELNKSTYNNAAAGALGKGDKDLALDFLSHSNEMGIEDDRETEETSRYMFFSNLQQIRRQAGLILDMDESEIQEILENGHDWAQDHIATAKESIDQVFDFIMNETKSGDMWKSVDVEDREDDEEDEEGIEEGMGLSHTVGKGTNEKPVNYPEELMRESIKNALSEAFANYTSTSANARPVSFSKATDFEKNLGSGVKLSDVVSAVKNVLKGKGNVKGELEKLKIKNWKGTPEGWHEFISNKNYFAGTNEGLEDIERTDYDFNERMLNYEKEEEARKELGDELVDSEDRYEQIVFLQDHEADHALNILMQDGEDDAMDYLMQWHQPGNHMTSEDAGFGSSDKTFERDGYTMAWNTSLGYISLVHDLDYSIDEDSQRKRHTAGQLGKVSKNIPLGQNAPHSDSAEEI